MTTTGVKFGRTYRVTIETPDSPTPIVVTLPFTMQYTVNRKLQSNMNSCTVEITGLSERVREIIFQEPYTVNINKPKTLTLEIGYDTLSTVYKGTIWEAYSYRDGTEIITGINCLAGSWDVNTTTVYTTLAKGQTLGDIFKFLCGQMPTVKVGAIGDFPQIIQRPITLNGNVWNLLKQYSNNQVFIDNDKIYVLQRAETLEGDIPLISTATGILETPKRAAGFVQVQTMMEPRIVLGQQIQLQSTVLPIYNGNYKVYGIQHTGTISGAVAGDARTVVDLSVGGQTFKTVLQNG